MGIQSLLRNLGFQPRRWWDESQSYSRYLGTIKPSLLAVSEEEFMARSAALKHGWWPKQVEVPAGRRILALSPHPDDESIGAGGLLWAHRNVSEIHVVVACNGDAGGELEGKTWEDTPSYKSQLVEQRKEEISKVCKLLNARSLTMLEFADGKIDLGGEGQKKLRSVIEKIDPDLILMPWFLDNLKDHRMLNILYASSCRDLRCSIFGYEVWSFLQPNAFFDISDHLDGKLSLVRQFTSQLKTVDYEGYVTGLARTRAFYQPVKKKRDGAIEAYLSLPNKEYCDLVTSFYGTADSIRPAVYHLLEMKK